MNGRWPANVILSPAMAEVLDGQTEGTRAAKASGHGGPGSSQTGAFGWSGSHAGKHEDAGGGASRFFLTAGYESWELEWILANGLRPCGTETE